MARSEVRALILVVESFLVRDFREEVTGREVPV